MAGYHIRPSHNSPGFESLLLAKICSVYIFTIYRISLLFDLFLKLLSKGLSALERQHKWSGDIIDVNAVIPFPPLARFITYFCFKFSYHYHLLYVPKLQYIT